MKEHERHHGGARLLDELAKDLGYGLRQLRRSPSFTFLATLTLAVGIGANTAIFSVVDAVLLRPLPYPEPDRLVTVWTRLDRAGIDRNGVSPPELMDLMEHDSFEAVSGFYESSASLGVNERPERVATVLASPGMFATLRVRPALGRAFVESDGEPGRDRVVVLSHELWLRHFGARRDVVEREIRLDGELHTIVGVMHEGFRPPLAKADLFRPLAFTPEERSDQERGSHYLDVVARLKPGIGLREAREALDALAARLDRDHPGTYRDAGFGISIGPLHEELVAGARTPLLLLMGAVGLVLLIACANVANLLLSRASRREREIALRTALGAGRFRLLRQLLAESMLLAFLGGSIAIWLSAWGVDLLRAFAPVDLPRLEDVRLDVRVLLCASGLTFATGILFGLAPALHRGPGDLPERLKDGASGSTAGRRGARLRSTLVVAETALATVLLIGAFLLVRSLTALGRVDPGLEPERLLTARVSLPEERYPDEPRIREFRETLLERISVLPGVRRVAATSHLPLSGSWMSRNFTIEGPSALGEGLSELEIQSYLVTPGYFETMGIPRSRGDDFSSRHTAESALEVIIDETFAEKLWPGTDPIGKRIRTGGLQSEASPWRTIIGVVGYVRHHGLDLRGREQLYFPFPQLPPPYARSLFVVVKTEGEPGLLAGAVERAVHSLDPELAVFDVRPMEERVASSLSQPRFRASLLALFAGAAVLLASIGVYGVLAFSVEAGRRETGVRMAMGARPGQVFRRVLRDGMGLTLLGIGSGLAAAAAAARLLESLLFEVRPHDAATFVLAPAILMLVALAAIYVPARRAMRMDPIAVLRHE